MLCLCYVLLNIKGSISNLGATLSSKAAAAVSSYLDRNDSDVYKRVSAQTIAIHKMAATV